MDFISCLPYTYVEAIYCISESHQWSHLQNEWLFLSQELPLANSSQCVLEIIYHVYVRLDRFIRSCLDMIMIAMPCSKDRTRQHSSPSPRSNILSAFPSTIFAEAWIGASWGMTGMACWGWALSLFLAVLWKSCTTPLLLPTAKRNFSGYVESSPRLCIKAQMFSGGSDAMTI